MSSPQPLISMTPSSVNARKAQADMSTDSSSSPTRPPKLPMSPSLPEFSGLRRAGARLPHDSDVHVQGLVKRFETLDVRDRDAELKELRRKDQAALRRAQIAQEEAEGDVKKFREDNRALRKDLQEERDRNRIVATRLEAVKDEYQRNKEEHVNTVGQYEKELRKSRKEALKSSSAIIKLQEELRAARKSQQVTQQGFDLEKQKVFRREEDTFNAQYQLAGVQEELEKLKMQMRVLQEEKDALKQSLQGEEVARIAAEGRIALPAAIDDGEEDEENKENNPALASPTTHKKIKVFWQAADLKDQLVHEKRARMRAEEMVEFLQLECRFHCCINSVEGQCTTEEPPDNQDQAASEVLPQPVDASIEPNNTPHVTNVTIEEQIDEEPKTPATPQHRSAIRTITTTTTIPMHFDTPVSRPVPNTSTSASVPRLGGSSSRQPVAGPETPHDKRQFTRPSSAGASPSSNGAATAVTALPELGTTTPGGFDRAAALAAIEFRRGRAKSIAEGRVTPGKAALQGVVRRDITR